jgi:hypothetical protein
MLNVPPNSYIYTTDNLYYINTKTFVNTKSYTKNVSTKQKKCLFHVH